MRRVATGLLTTAGAGLIAAAAALAAHRVVPEHIRDALQDYSGLITGMSGTLFALTASLMIVSAWTTIGEAKQNVAKEARAALDLYWYARTLPEQARTTIQTLMREYLSLVIDEEWRLMAAERRLSASVWGRIVLWQIELENIEPGGSTGDGIRYGHALNRASALIDARRIRSAQVTSSIPNPLWCALVTAGTFGLVLPVFVGTPHLVVHALLAAVAAMIVTFVLVLIAQLERPFSGAVRVEPTHLQRALEDMEVVDVAPIEAMPPGQRIGERYDRFMDAAWERFTAKTGTQRR